MEEKPNYYAIIPANVRYDKNLRDKAKLLYGEITSLSTKDGYCYATNKYFANLYNVSTTTISTLIKELIDNGYIESEIIYKEGTKEILNRYLKIFNNPYLKNFKYPIKENLKDNNINNNNININKEKYKKESYFENEELNNLFIEFLDLRKKIKCKNTDRAINLLLKELNKYDDKIKIEMINNSIMNSWKSVYPIKQNKKEQTLPEWFNKEYEVKYSKEAIEFEREVLGKIKK